MKSILIFAMLFSSVSAMANEMSSAQDDWPPSLLSRAADDPNM